MEMVESPAYLGSDKTMFMTEALIEQLNNRWKVDSIESGHSSYYILTQEVGRKYIKVMQHTSTSSGRSVYMFIDKKSGAVYKSASWKTPAKGIRFWIDQLANQPDICDPYGGFLYVR